jgi:hypothetical protein
MQYIWNYTDREKTGELQGKFPCHSVHHISTSTGLKSKPELPNYLSQVRPLRSPLVGKFVNKGL